MLRRQALRDFAMDSPAPHGFEDLHREEISRLFRRFLGVRLGLVPVLGGAVVALAVYNGEPWRLAVVVLFVGLTALVSVTEIRRYRRHGLARGAIALNVAVWALAHLAACLATGGTESPLLPLMPIISLFAGIWSERALTRLSIIGLQLAAVWAFAALAMAGGVPTFNLDLFGGGARAGHNDALLLTAATTVSLVMLVASTVGAGLRRVFGGMLRRADLAREESLRANAERTAELTALSGEIAHELKNPLASAKGLSALLARDLPEGKGAERLAVLRREIDRMQETLEEFLNFSRPLVPLSLEATGLPALAGDVAALHEGMARERRLSLELRAEECAVRCDPRKVRQVLINLLQNALDASPPGGAIEIEARAAEGGGALLRVLDRGHGLDAGTGERVFEPGVTTKAHGSGLGLTIARALARQHGGTLTLTNREGGGCVAELRLPADAGAAQEELREVSA
jgi:signal transduction histidine kinase